MQEVYIIDALRTPIGRYGGGLSHTRPDDLLAHVIRGLVLRNPKVDPAQIEDVIAGAANQSGEDNRNVARMSALLAGLPLSVGGSTVNRLCASGLQAVMDAARSIAVGEGDVCIAGGVENMSRAPYVMAKPDTAFSREPQLFDTTLGWRFTNAVLAANGHTATMGETAENVAERYRVSREDQDAFAFQSQQRYAQAAAEHRFQRELSPVDIGKKGAVQLFENDEHPRSTSLEQLAALRPVFKAGGTVTAGNSSGINDGAAALLLVSANYCKQYQLQPLAVIRSMAIAGVAPAFMGMGPVPATHKALQRAGIKATDLSLIELNEAFAAQAIACIRELQLDPGKVNINGGAIALGHPLGCSGARILTTLVYELQRSKGRFGLATMCVGVGQGAAMIVEKL